MAFDNIIRFNSSTSGVTDFVVLSAPVGCFTPEQAGATDGKTYRYFARSPDGLSWEWGAGAYVYASHTQKRTTVENTSNGSNALINFPFPPIVDVFPAAPPYLELASAPIQTSLQAQVTALAARVYPNFIGGLTASTAGGSNSFSIAAGAAMDSTNVQLMAFAAAMTKTTAAWVAGTGNGARDGSSLTNSTWYHVHLIWGASVNPDIMISTNVNAPSPLPSGYTLSRRIWSMFLNSAGNWSQFTQLGNQCIFISDDVGLMPFANVAIGTGPTTLNPTVPPGIKVIAQIRCQASSGGTGNLLLFSPDQSISGSMNPFNVISITVIGNTIAGEFDIRTDTNRNIGVVSSINTITVYCTTKGYIDYRGFV